MDNLYKMDKKVIFIMGKGGVGKMMIVVVIVMVLVDKGKKVYLVMIDLVVYF